MSSIDTSTHELSGREQGTRRLTTETKPSTKTTELIAYVAVVVAIVVTAFVVNEGEDGGRDPFSALHALQLVTYLTIGYMVARGLAKAGSRDAYDA